jgi:hypothetical protein
MIFHRDFRVLQAIEFAKACYRPVVPATAQVAHGLAVRRIFSLATAFGRLGYPAWAKEVSRWVRSKSEDTACILCRWSGTVKTHKPGGKAVIRSIHSFVGHMRNALYEVVNRMLEPVLGRHHLICWSTEDAHARNRSARVNLRSLLVTHDINELFPSGERMKLSETVSSHFAEKEASWIS